MATITHDGEEVPLPRAVVEQPTSKTSIYEKGVLIHDGAAEGNSQAAAPQMPGSSLNQMLQWGIAHSDPAELQRRAEQGVVQPAEIDKEIMDMLLGQPIVAKMRDALAKLSSDAIQQPGGVVAAGDALQELEYYVEDLDNANDFGKIGGMQVMMTCFSALDLDPDVREAACGVLATCLQNNPKLQDASIGMGVPEALLLLLSGRESGQAALKVRRRAASAISALLRSSPTALEYVLTLPQSLPIFAALAADDDSRLRRRGLFLLISLLRDESLDQAKLLSVDGMNEILLQATCHQEEELRDMGIQLWMELLPSGERLRELLQIPALDADRRLASTLEMSLRESQAGDGNPEHPAQLRQLLAWLRKA